MKLPFFKKREEFKEKAGFGTREKPAEMTRGRLVEVIYDTFLAQLKSETTPNQLLFPASFTIYLEGTDFENRKDGFPFTVKELVNLFNREIRDRKKARYADYVAHSKFWYFKFNCFPEGGNVVIDGKVHETLANGEALIQCQLLPDRNLAELNLPRSGSGRRVVTTVVDKNPIVPTDTGAINPQSIKGVTAKPGFVYVVEFSDFKDLTNEKFTEPEPVKQAGAAFGKLQVYPGGPAFLVNDRAVSTFEITTPELYISGKNDAASINGIPVLRLDSDEVFSPHIHLKAVSPGLFKVWANGPVWVAGIQLDGSTKESAELRRGDEFIIGGGDDIIIKVY